MTFTRDTSPTGLPSVTESHPLIEVIGEGCCLSPTLSIWRRGDINFSDPLIVLGNQVVVLDYVRFVAGAREEFSHAGIKLGDRVIVNAGSYVSGEGGLTIEEEVLVGPHVKILSAGHEIDGGGESIYWNDITYAPVHIGAGAWIGAGATVTQGCTIGRGAVVAAGAVVTRDVPPFGVVTGVPARLQRYRNVNG